MNEVIDAFRRVIPIRHKRSGRGWIQFDCPACGDRRGRGGFLETPTGGFQYRCQNGGCEYERTTGWQPGSGFGFVGRARKIFHMLGGDISDIPEHYLDYHQKITLSTDEWIAWMMSDPKPLSAQRDEEFIRDFPEVALPSKTELLWDAKSSNALEAQQYVLDRGIFYQEYPFCWSPKYPKHVIIPFLHHNKVVGWIGRKFDGTKEFAHIKSPDWPTDYMLNQHQLFKYPIVLVQEGTFDAIALKSLCTFGNTLSKRQINLLKSAHRTICLLPDYHKEEWRNYWQVAKENHWCLAAPEWPGDDGYSSVDHIKDAGDSIRRNGLLYTLETVMESMTTDYDFAESVYMRRSRG